MTKNGTQPVFALRNIRGKQLFGFLAIVSLIGLIPLVILGIGWYYLLPVTIFCSQFGYKELHCYPTHVILHYPLRPFLRSVKKDVTRIRKVRTFLEKGSHGRPLIQLYFRHNFLPFEFRLTQWEEAAGFLQVMAAKGTFELRPVDCPGTIDQIIQEIAPSPGFRVYKRR